MRILHVVTMMTHLSGAENHLLSLVREQVSLGHAVDVTWLKGDGEITDSFRGVGCRRLFRTRFEHPHHFFSAIATLRREVSEQSYDVVHTHLLKADAVGGLAARLSRVKPAVISTKHNDEHVLRKPGIGRIHGLICRAANDHVICISNHVRNFIDRYGHVPQDRSSRIYYGFDRRSYPDIEPLDLKTEFQLPDNAFVFGTIGRLTEQKNQLFLLPVFAEIANAHPHARLLLVGSDGYSPTYRHRIEKSIEELGIGDKVVLTGWRHDAYSILAALDCMVLPSQWEGLGVVFMEAIGLGVPVISFRASAIPEVVRDGIDGFLVEPGDSAGLHVAMARVIDEHESIAARTRVGGPAYIAQKFRVETMVEQIFAVYRKALDRKGGNTG